MFVPEWKGVIEGWTVNYLTANYWRVASSYPYLDTLHEAHVVFLHVRNTYQVEDGAHFMALYKTSWVRRFADLSTEDTWLRQLQLSADSNELIDRRTVDNEGELAVKFRQAPSEVVMVLSMLLNAPQELLDIALGGLRRDGHISKRGNKIVNRLLGLPADNATLETVRDYFSN